MISHHLATVMTSRVFFIGAVVLGLTLANPQETLRDPVQETRKNSSEELSHSSSLEPTLDLPDSRSSSQEGSGDEDSSESISNSTWEPSKKPEHAPPKSSNEPKDAKSEGSTSQIAKIKDYPWIVAVLYYKDGKWVDRNLEPTTGMFKGTFKVRMFGVCPGSLIKISHVVTACHCLVDHAYNGSSWGAGVKPKYPPWVKVRAGSDHIGRDLTEGAELSDVIWLALHPRCLDEGLLVNSFDVGLLALASPFLPSEKVASFPIANFYLGSEEEWEKDAEENIACKVLSWGTLSGGYQLLKKDVLLLDSGDCKQRIDPILALLNAPFNFHNDSHLCAIDAPGALCDSETGGPLYCGKEQRGGKPILYAVVKSISFKGSCEDPHIPSVFTKTTDEITWWIHTVTKRGSEESDLLNAMESDPAAKSDEGELKDMIEADEVARKMEGRGFSSAEWIKPYFWMRVLLFAIYLILDQNQK